MSFTPNLTELFYLLGIPYKEMNTDEELKSYPSPAFRLWSRSGDYLPVCPYGMISIRRPCMPITGTVTATGRLRVLTCRPIIPERGIRLPVSSPEHCCKATVCPLPWTVPRSSFCKVSVLLSDTSTTTVKVYSFEKVLHNLDMPIQICSYELI